jgi:folate-binding protein YgfZ
MPDLRCVTLESRGIARLAGEDARDFLQGLISNDVALLTPERALYAALLTPQGKYLFDFLLYDRGDVILLECEGARLPALLQRLTMYRLRAKVAIEDVSEAFAVMAVLGRAAADAFALPHHAAAARLEGEAVLAVDPRSAELGVRALLPRSGVDSFVRAHGLTPAPFAEWDRVRLGLGVPDGSRDLVIEKSILLESGFEELNGVSFTKGCFVGQELTARTKHRGLIKKRLVPVRVHGSLPAPGTAVTRGEREAGEMRSGVEGEAGMDGIGLALLRLDQLAPDAAARGPLKAGDVLLTPAPPLWLELTAQD